MHIFKEFIASEDEQRKGDWGSEPWEWELAFSVQAQD